MPEPPPVTSAAFPDQSIMLDACAAEVFTYLCKVGQYNSIPQRSDDSHAMYAD